MFAVKITETVYALVSGDNKEVAGRFECFPDDGFMFTQVPDKVFDSEALRSIASLMDLLNDDAMCTTETSVPSWDCVELN
jgi:hypothetical protein